MGDPRRPSHYTGPVRIASEASPIETPFEQKVIEANLRAKGFQRALNSLPPWARVAVVAIAFGAGSGGALAGVSKWIGIETVTGATAREARLNKKIANTNNRITELQQSLRSDGLTDQAKEDVSDLLKASLGQPVKPKKRKPKPVVVEKPDETEDETHEQP